jgi:radical SAM superfamily enzyme YgiQ (UPF0313 family)
MRVILISTYDLGRQPFGLASPAAWLRRAGIETVCVDTSRDSLSDAQILAASLIAFYLPMHTATRLALPLVEQVRRINPSVRLCAYGLYAPLNAEWLRARGVGHILGPEAESDLVDLVKSQVPTPNSQRPNPESRIPSPGSRGPEPGSQIARLQFIRPDRDGLPPLARYAAVEMPDGQRRVAGSTDASRGCKHFCRHCPVVPVYHGQFRVVPVDVVLADIRVQVAAGAQHISFGDPDFLNGPTHARKVVESLAAEWPGLSYDVTIKIEHLLKHADMLPVLRDTGCLFVTSAVESTDDNVLHKLRKGHTRADFLNALDLCRTSGLTLNPTFVPFTPWTTLQSYLALLQELHTLDLADAVAPIQLAIRLLVTATSPLLELPEIASATGRFDPAFLIWPWRHEDPRVDTLQADVMRRVTGASPKSRSEVFADIRALAHEHAGLTPPSRVNERSTLSGPHVNEPWYCCAEPSGDAGLETREGGFGTGDLGVAT